MLVHKTSRKVEYETLKLNEVSLNSIFLNESNKAEKVEFIDAGEAPSRGVNALFTERVVISSIFNEIVSIFLFYWNISC